MSPTNSEINEELKNFEKSRSKYKPAERSEPAGEPPQEHKLEQEEESLEGEELSEEKRDIRDEEIERSRREENEARERRMREEEKQIEEGRLKRLAEGAAGGLTGLAGAAAMGSGDPKLKAVGAVLSGLSQRSAQKKKEQTEDKRFQNLYGGRDRTKGSKGGRGSSFKSGFVKGFTAPVSIAKGSKIWIFAIVAIFIHLADLFTGFRYDIYYRSMFLVLYSLFTFWAVFFVYKTGFSRASWNYVAISLFAWAMPYIRMVPWPKEVSNYLIFVMALLPIWFLYISFNDKDHPMLQRLGYIIMAGFVFLILILLLGVVINRNLLPRVTDVGANVGGSFKRVFIDFGDSWSVVWDKVKTAFNPAIWKNRINQTLNPRAYLYTGRVEKNKKEPTGVFITKLESLSKSTPIGTEPIIFGRVSAVTFLEHGVNVTPSCRLERAGRGAYLGTPDVEGPIEVNTHLPADVMCTFPADPNMTQGTYYGVMGVSFNFETWAYLTNTFVSKSLINSYNVQGRNINRDLHISPESQAIFTNGPVKVGMSTAEQPIAIDPDAGSDRFITQRFGFSLMNNWPQGEVERGTVDADVLIPEPFELRDCKPTSWVGEPKIENGMRRYSFSRSPDLQLDARTDYQTVTCQLYLPNKEAAEKVLNFGDKTPATFVVIARYGYKIEEKTPVRMEE